MFQASQQINFSQLLKYRTDVIDAFLDLFAGFAQYLKDCFCERLMVECPSCDEDDQLYLGTISIRVGQISKVCNWTKRRYVKSFPTIGHWLSLIPVSPILHWVVEQICCTALPEYFGAKEAPPPSPAIVANPHKAPYSTTKFSGGNIHALLLGWNSFSATSLFDRALAKIGTGGGFVNNIFQSWIQPPTTPASTFKTNAILGRSADDSKVELGTANIQVDSVVRADPSSPVGNLQQFLATPSSLPPNSGVTLVTDQNGVVLGVIPTSKDVAALRTSLADSQKQITDATTQVQQLSQTTDQLKTQVQGTAQTLALNQAALATLNTMPPQITSLQSQITTLQTTHAADLATRDKQIADLTTNLAALTKKVG
jgi:hypothetical protein